MIEHGEVAPKRVNRTTASFLQNQDRRQVIPHTMRIRGGVDVAAKSTACHRCYVKRYRPQGTELLPTPVLWWQTVHGNDRLRK